MSTNTKTDARKGVVFGLLFTAVSMAFLILFGGMASAQEAPAEGTSEPAATAASSETAPVAADSGSTTNGSGGDATVGTGDAESTGSGSDPTVSQTVQGHNGAIVIVGQDANVSNSGNATANTGGNTATGNDSDNTATSDQEAGSGGSGSGVNNNTSDTSNGSGGTATINTGDATATGNSSSTDVNQTADVNICEASNGCLGGIVIIDQDASVSNSGSATATTGDNTATGNGSSNTASSSQGATGDGSIGNNTATTSNSSDGSAGINTGDADATGNSSSTGVNQIANATIGGSLGGIVIINQSAHVSNSGDATADTGGNDAIGNESTNGSNTVQGAVSGAGPPSGSSIANNDGQATNHSDGSATINSGDATATGNNSDTNITQQADVSVAGTGLVLVNQDSSVSNSGSALASTGGNTATGNASTNIAENGQLAETSGGNAGTSVAANFGTSSNSSDGSADITTGNADATGNASTTNVAQGANIDTDGGLTFVDQTSHVDNSGDAEAFTGDNDATGNVSFNLALNGQAASSGDAGGTSVAGNFGEAVNTSDGSASIATGDATATGNDSDESTTVTQVADVSGSDLVFVDQSAHVDNAGSAIADTGLNSATGNASFNTAASDEFAEAGAGDHNSVPGNFGSASNTSDGSASIATGDATATGNAATTNIAQTADVDGDGNSIVFVDQSADVDNTGGREGNFALASTGGNDATGNVSFNEADNFQTALTGDSSGNSVAANFGSASNTSDGSADITTGNATATGNAATTNIAQTADVDGDGSGFVFVDQSADVHNAGFATADTGGNTAVGNVSLNIATNDQASFVDDATAGNAVASNDGQAINDSDGSASITTGDATAVGNDSSATTNIIQAANVSIPGAGFALVSQVAAVGNAGFAAANTGGNAAVGNASLNIAGNFQIAAVTESGPGSLHADSVVASNVGNTVNHSNGSADVTTGAATATGNASTDNIGQLADVEIGGTGFAIVDQSADVDNVGEAEANSGFNSAEGNLSTNFATNQQLAGVRELGAGDLNADNVVASNIGTTTNTSDGTGSVTTGDATATGNSSLTNVGQLSAVDIAGSGFVLSDQDVHVTNAGFGAANTGFNSAVGNESFNDASNNQRAAVREGGSGDLDADDVVASNIGTTSNTSDGTGIVTTGDATATGNSSLTNAGQLAHGDVAGSGFVIADQDVTVDNAGAGLANSGFNFAGGNGSDNTADNRQRANVREQGAGDLTGGDVVSSNIGTTSNTSDGTGIVTTGDATATGNSSTTNVGQLANSSIDGTGFVITGQSAAVGNFGLAAANSGFNAAVGNGSTNVAGNRQRARVRETGAGHLTAGDIVSSNVGTASNTSDGTGSVTTGDATAIGNDAAATTNIGQVANADISGSGFVLSDQDATVLNAGAALANTGLNFAAGNVSDNTAANVQRAGVFGATEADDVVASNIGTASNTSDGTGSVTTGDATAIGNQSTTDVFQVADASIDGSGFVLSNQDATVVNAGLALANSGLNAAVGNASENDADNDQTAAVASPSGDLTAGDVVASNVGTTSNTSNGTASIVTDCACAIGNDSTTTVVQDSGADITGTGFVLADQSADVTNVGFAAANSGFNAAVGNASINDADNLQLAAAGSLFGSVDAGNIVANNTATTSNTSDGTATIHTGDATAVGNLSETTVVQTSEADMSGFGGFALVDQDADVVNAGAGFANSGFNFAAGNVSDNDAENFQLAAAGSIFGDVTADDVIANNVGQTSNVSDGTAGIVTGNASAFGNVSTTDVVQDAATSTAGFGIALIDQDADVTNVGLAGANSGFNAAVGNESDNTAGNFQVSLTGTLFGNLVADSAVANNTATTVNDSDGTATIDTGDAFALGNLSGTSVSQAADCTGVFICLPSQGITVFNAGAAAANSGFNFASGNSSLNGAVNVQVAAVLGGVGDLIANNVGGVANVSDGLSAIGTGAATAFGNVSATTACQGFNADPDCEPAVLPDIPTPPIECGKETPPKETPPEVTPPKETPPEVTPPKETPPEVTPPEETPPTTPVVEVVEVFENVTAPAQAGLAVTGVSVAVQVLFGLLLLAIGALLRRKKSASA